MSRAVGKTCPSASAAVSHYCKGRQGGPDRGILSYNKSPHFCMLFWYHAGMGKGVSKGTRLLSTLSRNPDTKQCPLATLSARLSRRLESASEDYLALERSYYWLVRHLNDKKNMRRVTSRTVTGNWDLQAD